MHVLRKTVKRLKILGCRSAFRLDASDSLPWVCISPCNLSSLNRKSASITNISWARNPGSNCLSSLAQEIWNYLSLLPNFTMSLLITFVWPALVLLAIYGLPHAVRTQLAIQRQKSSTLAKMPQSIPTETGFLVMIYFAIMSKAPRNSSYYTHGLIAIWNMAKPLRQYFKARKLFALLTRQTYKQSPPSTLKTLASNLYDELRLFHSWEKGFSRWMVRFGNIRGPWFDQLSAKLTLLTCQHLKAT